VAKAAHGEPVAWKLAHPVRREGRRNHPLQGGQALFSYSTLDDRAAPIAASMTWQGTKTAGLAAEGPEQREGWRHLSVLFRDGKSRESSGRRKTREDRHCEASGGAAGFRASRVLRGSDRRGPHAEAQGFRLRTSNTDRTRAVANKPDVSARSRFEGKGSREGRFAKARSGAGWKPAKAECFRGS